MKRFWGLLLCFTLLLSLLTGCGDVVKPMVMAAQPLTISEVAGSRLVASTASDAETDAYEYAGEHVVLDSESLLTVAGSDERNIRNLVQNITTQLAGAGGTTLSETQAGYLLTEFARSKYIWKQSDIDVVGYDPATRFYFVDVTYETTQMLKEVIPDSKIPNGSEDANKLRQKRYADYLTLLSLKNAATMSSRDMTEEYEAAYASFVSAWGEIEEIFAEQQGVTLYERTLGLVSDSTTVTQIGRLTYSGMLRNKELNGAATMTVRYVLTYSLNLGEETGLSVVALYVKDYSVRNPELALSAYSVVDPAALSILKPVIDNTILSYQRCVEESNEVGLCSLFFDYGALDKYYDELRDLTYISSGGYTFEVIGRNNRHLFVKVTSSNQIRGRDSEMSLPTYEEVTVYDLYMGADDSLYVYSTALVSRKLVGEPASVIRNVSGISEKISYSAAAFSAENKVAVEQLLKDFSAVVANGDVSSDAFLRCVDLGVSSTTLTRMVDTILSITPNRLVTYVVSWGTQTNVYCNVTVREVFECDNGAYDTQATISMCNGDNGWRVTGYSRSLSIKTALSNLDTSSAFCAFERSADGTVTQIAGSTDHESVGVNTPEYREDGSSQVLPNTLPNQGNSGSDTGSGSGENTGSGQSNSDGSNQGSTGSGTTDTGSSSGEFD